MARPTYVASAMTPSQPTSGTGRGRLGLTNIRCSQSTRLRSASAMSFVKAMNGLVSRLASSPFCQSVNESWSSVREVPGSTRVSVPSVKNQTTAQTATTPAAGIQRLRLLGSGTGGTAPGSTGFGDLGGASVLTPLPRRPRPA